MEDADGYAYQPDDLPPSEAAAVNLEVEIDESDSDDDVMDTDENSNGISEPVRKIHDSSAVWDESASKIFENGLIVGSKCNFCPKTYQRNNGNTSNLIKHIIKQHKKEHADVVARLENKIKDKKEKQKEKRKQDEKKSKNQPKILNWMPRKGVIDPVKRKKIEKALEEYVVATNKPFSEVENHFFRKLLFVAEPNFVCSSRKTLTYNCDKSAEEARNELKKEIVEDIKPHKTLNITSDHGTSADKFRTKKNAVTAAWCTKDFVIKKATIDLYKCEGKQRGIQIRQDVKNSLDKYAGREEDWRTNWVTDGEFKQLNARDPDKHQDVGFKTFLTGTCVDHTFELVCESTIEQIPEMNGAHKALRGVVNYIKDSSMARECLHSIQLRMGVTPLSMILGTANRWFHKYCEVKRALLLRAAIEEWYVEFDVPASVPRLDDEDWNYLLIYQNALSPIVEAAKVLEGELYPTASSVIPFLDQIICDLSELSLKLDGEGKKFVDRLLTNLQTSTPARFPNGYKDRAPYNILTCLDIRYGNLYIDTPDLVNKVYERLAEDVIYEDDRSSEPELTPAVTASEPAPSADLPDKVSKLQRRRAQLLAARASQASTSATSTDNPLTFREKLKEELDRILLLGGSLDYNENPNPWWKIHHEEFPLLAKFWMANCPFPATSTSSERVFNMDNLVIDPQRKSLTEDRSKHLVIHRDLLMRKANNNSYRLCEQCPMPPNPNSSYQICCSVHH